MTTRAFMIACQHAAIIANDVNDFRYRAMVQHLGLGETVPVRCVELAEAQFMVESGTVEFMIGGATGMAFAGDFVRVPPGQHFGYRNAGDQPARVLVRSASPSIARRAFRIAVEHAA